MICGKYTINLEKNYPLTSFFQGNRIKTANKKACDYSICGSTTISLRRLKYT